MAFFNEFPNTRTYDSDLGWLISKIKEISDEVQSFVDFQETIQEGFDDLTARFETLYNQVQSWQDEIDNFKVYVQAQIDRQNADIDRRFIQIEADIAAQMAQYLADLSAQIQAIRDYATSENLLTRAYVDAKIAELIASIPDLTTVQVYNPVRNNLLTSIQIAIDDIYELVARAEAITAAEYDSTALTAAEYDGLHLTAYDYDHYASRYIAGEVDPSNLNYMFSPISGTWLPVRSVVLQLVKFHLIGITAAAYDALGLTAAEYDAKNITAYDYDAHGVTI